jgi:hypothetical protein
MAAAAALTDDCSEQVSHLARLGLTRFHHTAATFNCDLKAAMYTAAMYTDLASRLGYSCAVQLHLPAAANVASCQPHADLAAWLHCT